MLSCRDLDGFVDKLCDLTRDMPNLARAREAAELLDLIEQVPQRFLMQWRAAAVADEHYLNGESIREIAKEVGKSFQGVSAWLRDHGPTHYLSLVNEAGAVRAVPFPVDGENTKVTIRQFRSAGRVIVPAVENAIDPDTGDVYDWVVLKTLWQRYAPSAS
jgi:hypothetical protein